MIVCSSNPQAKKIKSWFHDNSDLKAGLVISDEEIPSEVNKKTQLAFKETLQPDILVVHQMLTTGYDVNRLKKMYLLRNAKEHTLLQTISRVNRPYKSPAGKTYQYGYIVDFVDIAEEYDRTIEMYLKEMEADFGGDEEEGQVALTGLIIGPDDVNAKYKKYADELEDIIDTKNIERFSRSLTYMNKDALLTIRRLLNGIKTCYTEFKLSRADEYIKQIDIEHIKKLLKAIQARIDFVNISSTPTTLLTILSNKEVVDIFYEFLKTKIEILDLGKLEEAMKQYVDSEEYNTMTTLVEQVQKELKRNKNHSQIAMVKLDEVLKKLFEMLDISNLNEVNEELRKILEEARRINDENERLAARYDGNYAFVKTYSDAIEAHPEYKPEDIAEMLDIVYEVVKNIQSSNILVLQGRDLFIAKIKSQTITQLIKDKLYGKLNLKDWYDDVLNETYSNMKIF